MCYFSLVFIFAIFQMDDVMVYFNYACHILIWVLLCSILQRKQNTCLVLAQACPVSTNPDWLMLNLLRVQNKSAQISNAISFLQSLCYENYFVQFAVLTKNRNINKTQTDITQCLAQPFVQHFLSSQEKIKSVFFSVTSVIS